MSIKYHLISYQGVRLYVLDEFKLGGRDHFLCLDFRPATEAGSKYCMALLRKCGFMRRNMEHIDIDARNIGVIRSRLHDASIFSAMDAMQGLHRYSTNTEEHKLLAAFIADLRDRAIL